VTRSRPLADRTALVTGANRGIGRAIALALVREGADLVLAARAPDTLAGISGEVHAHGGRALAVACDVTVPASIDAAVQEALDSFGRIDILVNNAGTAGSSPVTHVDDAAWADAIAVNLTGVFLCTRAVLPGMIERAYGRVINVASVASRVGFAYSAPYCAAKHGVLGFTRAVALEVARRGVTVNAVCPGWVDTDMTSASIARIVARTGRSPEEARRALEEMNPMRRLMRPEEVADVVVMLAGESAGGITGQAINVDGGEVMS